LIIRTDALVLRSMDYRETSKIVTLFTRDKGKMSVLAKGARQARSRFGATLEPMSFIQAVYYYKPTRTLQTLSESSHLYLFSHIGRDLEKITIGLRMVELVQALLQEEEQQQAVFNLLAQALQRLDAADARAANLLLYFQLRLADALGFGPSFDRDAVQALPEEGGILTLDTGAILPAGTPRNGLRASRAALRAFAICTRADLETIMQMHLTPECFRDAHQLVEQYLRYHVEEAYPTRSDKVIAQLLEYRTSGKTDDAP